MKNCPLFESTKQTYLLLWPCNHFRRPYLKWRYNAIFFYCPTPHVTFVFITDSLYLFSCFFEKHSGVLFWIFFPKARNMKWKGWRILISWNLTFCGEYLPRKCIGWVGKKKLLDLKIERGLTSTIFLQQILGSKLLLVLI